MLVLVPTAFEAAILFGEAAASQMESTAVTPCELAGRPVTAGLCGFGLAAAGAGAAVAMIQHQRLHPSSDHRTVLVGIAGGYDRNVTPVGSAIVASSAQCVGIGVGSGANHLGAAAMGWSQGLDRAALPPVADSLSFLVPPSAASAGPARHLLSVAAASAERAEARARAAQWPEAAVEEMEAFSVGLAARLLGAELVVIRGISNVAGDREKGNWRVREALDSAKALLAKIMEQENAGDSLGGRT